MAAMGIAMMSVLAMGMVSIQFTNGVEQHRSHEETRAVLAAEAGLSRSYMEMQNWRNGDFGSAQQPLTLASGDVWVGSQTFGATGKLVRLTATGRWASSDARAELILQNNVETLFVWGAFGDTSLKMSSQAKIDSYDSVLGTYASQAVNSSGSNTWANDEGNVGSNGSIDIKQNAIVMGDATPGEYSTISVVGSATVSGSTANASSAVVLDPIVVPAIPSSGNMTFAANTSLPAGNYHWGTTEISTNKVVTISGPATVVFDSFEMKSGSQILIDSTAGPVDFYVINSFIMSSNTLFAPLNKDPRDLRLNMLSDNIIDPGVVVQLDELALNSNAQFYGTMYAPDAKVDIQSNFEIFGAVVAEEIILGSNSRVHYDEALGRVLPVGSQRFTCLSWRAMH